MLLTAFAYYRVRSPLFFLIKLMSIFLLRSYNTEKKRISLSKKHLKTENIPGKNIQIRHRSAILQERINPHILRRYHLDLDKSNR